MSEQVIHEKENHRFILTKDGQLSELKYRMISADTIDYYSTFTPPALRGQGVGPKLVEAALKYAKSMNYKVEASCWYVAKHL